MLKRKQMLKKHIIGITVKIPKKWENKIQLYSSEFCYITTDNKSEMQKRLTKEIRETGWHKKEPDEFYAGNPW